MVPQARDQQWENVYKQYIQTYMASKYCKWSLGKIQLLPAIVMITGMPVHHIVI